MNPAQQNPPLPEYLVVPPPPPEGLFVDLEDVEVTVAGQETLPPASEDDEAGHRLGLLIAEPADFLEDQFVDAEAAKASLASIAEICEDMNPHLLELVRAIAQMEDPESNDQDHISPEPSDYALWLMKALSGEQRAALYQHGVNHARDEQDLAKMAIVFTRRATLGRQLQSQESFIDYALPHLLRPSEVEDPRNRVVRFLLSAHEGNAYEGSRRHGYSLCCSLLHQIIHSEESGRFQFLDFLARNLPEDHPLLQHSYFYLARLILDCTPTDEAPLVPDDILAKVAAYCSESRFEMSFRSEVELLNSFCPELSKYLPFALPEDVFRAIYNPNPIVDVEVRERFSDYSKRRLHTLKGWESASAAEINLFRAQFVFRPDVLRELSNTAWEQYFPELDDVGQSTFSNWLKSEAEKWSHGQELSEKRLRSCPGILIGATVASGGEDAVAALSLYPCLTDLQRKWLAIGFGEHVVDDAKVLGELEKWPPQRLSTFLSQLAGDVFYKMLQSRIGWTNALLSSCRTDLERFGDNEDTTEMLTPELSELLDSLCSRRNRQQRDPFLKALRAVENFVELVPDDAITDLYSDFVFIDSDAEAVRSAVGTLLQRAQPEIAEEEDLPAWFQYCMTDDLRKELGLSSWHALQAIGIGTEGDLEALGITEEEATQAIQLRRDIENVVDVIRRYADPSRFPERQTPFVESPEWDQYWQTFFEIPEVESVNLQGLHPAADPSTYFPQLFDPRSSLEDLSTRARFRFISSLLNYVSEGNEQFLEEFVGALEAVEDRLTVVNADGEKPSKRQRLGKERTIEEVRGVYYATLWEGLSTYKRVELGARLSRYLGLDMLRADITDQDRDQMPFMIRLAECLSGAGIPFDDAAADKFRDDFMPDPTYPVQDRFISKVRLMELWQGLRSSEAGPSRLQQLRAGISSHLDHPLVQVLWPEDVTAYQKSIVDAAPPRERGAERQRRRKAKQPIEPNGDRKRKR